MIRKMEAVIELTVPVILTVAFERDPYVGAFLDLIRVHRPTESDFLALAPSSVTIDPPRLFTRRSHLSSRPCGSEPMHLKVMQSPGRTHNSAGVPLRGWRPKESVTETISG